MLEVASPNLVQPQGSLESPVTPILQIDEGIKVVTAAPHFSCEIFPAVHEQEERTEVEASTSQCTPRSQVGLDHNYSGDYVENRSQVVMGETYPPLQVTQTPPPQFNQYLSSTGFDRASHENPMLLSQGDIFGAEGEEIQVSNEQEVTMQEFPGEYTQFSITRRELTTINNFLGRIPPDSLTGDGANLDQLLSLSVVDVIADPVMVTTSSQEELSGPSSSMAVRSDRQYQDSTHYGKRRRPKYSLTVGKLKKHPVLQFSATGPLDADKTPYRWWCRVCRVELSLMSREPLELVSHYRTDSHLIKEHRIRMEITGMPLFDKDCKEILGTALQNAKKAAKDTYPIAPQLDSRHPLAGRSAVPATNIASSPTEKVLFQITILEFGLRNGGHVDNLSGIYGEVSRLTSSNVLSTQNWSDQRLYVSILF